MGCDISMKSGEETREVSWIYYGNSNTYKTGCFWIQESSPDIGWIDAAGIGYGWLGGMFLNCIDYGEKDYIRHNINFNYFSIESESAIYPQYYDTLMFGYKDTNLP